MTDSILKDIQKLEIGSVVTLYTLDLSTVPVSPQVTDIYRWCDGMNEKFNDIVFEGLTYTRYPIAASGFDKPGDGTLPRPKLQIANLSGALGAIAKDTYDLLGAKLTRVRTLEKYLDPINFNIAPTVSPSNQILDTEVWYIDRKASENKLYIEWELAAPIDLVNVYLPNRLIMQNMCYWNYKGSDGSCGYVPSNYSNRMFDEDDNPVVDEALDVCSKTLNGCRKRFGTAPLSFGGFPGVGLLR